MDSRPNKPEEALFDSSFEGEFFGSSLDLIFSKSNLDGQYLYIAIVGI